MPFFFIEGRYENEGASDACLRAQAYWSILSGSTGHFFGNNPIWPFNSGIWLLKPSWKDVLDSAGSRSMTHLGKLFASRAWYRLVPDQNHTALIADYGSTTSGDYIPNHVAAALDSEGNTFMAYLPYATSVTVNLAKITGPQAKVWWYDPSDGKLALEGTYPASGLKSFNPPSSGDWVLVIDNATLNLPAPGVPVVPLSTVPKMPSPL
jgi:hypothetical protein